MVCIQFNLNSAPSHISSESCWVFLQPLLAVPGGQTAKCLTTLSGTFSLASSLKLDALSISTYSRRFQVNSQLRQWWLIYRAEGINTNKPTGIICLLGHFITSNRKCNQTKPSEETRNNVTPVICQASVISLGGKSFSESTSAAMFHLNRIIKKNKPECHHYKQH